MQTVEVIPTWLMNSLVGLLGLLFLLAWSIYKTMQNRKRVKGQILVELWRKKGTVDEEFYPVDIQEISIKDNETESITNYYIREDAIYHELFPKKALFPWTQVTIQKAAFQEGNSEPIVKRLEAPVATAKLIAGLREESFTQFAVQASQHIKDLNEALNKTIKPSTLYFLLIAIATVSVVGAVLSFTVYNSIGELMQSVSGFTESVEELLKGAGIVR